MKRTRRETPEDDRRDSKWKTYWTAVNAAINFVRLLIELNK